MTQWVYRRTEPHLWTVGFYRPDECWESESDHDREADAAKRVHYLNGGNNDEERWAALDSKLDGIRDGLANEIAALRLALQHKRTN